jgi:hypothetical protein
MSEVTNIGTPEREAQVILEESDRINRWKFAGVMAVFIFMVVCVAYATATISQAGSVVYKWLVG